MTSNIVNLHGVEFNGPDSPVMSSTDGSIVIMKDLSGEFTSFSVINKNLEDVSSFLNNFNIKMLAIENLSPEKIICDLNSISNISNLEKLFLELGAQDTLVNSEKLMDADGLTELSIKGEFPNDFIQPSLLKNLCKLTIRANSKKSKQWLSKSQQVVDLIVHDYSEKNLEIFDGFSKLTRICLVQGRILGFDGIEKIHNLQTIHIVACKYISDVQSIVKSRSLKGIMFEQVNYLLYWDFLSNIKQLEFIWLELANNISFIENLPILRYFKCKKIIDEGDELIKSFGFENLPPRASIFYTPLCK